MTRHTTTIFKPRQYNYEIIIPAAGMGRRMKSYGPKSLTQIGTSNCTIINNQLKIIKKLFQQYVVILVCGFQSDKIMNYVPQDIIIVENERYLTTNVVRSLSIGLRATTGNHVLIVYGDLVFNYYTLNCNFDESCMIVNKTMSSDEVGCIIQDGCVENISYDLENKWSQIVYLTGKELDLFKRFCWDDNNEKKFGYEGLNEVIKQGGKFKAIYPRHSKVIDVDKSADIVKAKEII